MESEEEESDTGSDSDSDSEELGAAGNAQEAEMLRLITGDSESDGIGEEPFEVALSTNAIEGLMPGLGSEEEKHGRTVNAVIVRKAETCKDEFEKMAALVKSQKRAVTAWPLL